MPLAKVSPINFRLAGLEPADDVAWRLAGPVAHLAFWREAARYGLIVKDKSLARGLDKHGERMEISERTRENRRSAMGRAYPHAPALTPSFGRSRTRSYLRARADSTGVTYFWRFDRRLGHSWGLILTYQAGAGRDVIGFSAADHELIARHMAWWWRRHRTRLAMPRAVVNGLVVELAAPVPRLPRVVQPVVPRVVQPVVQDLSRYTFGSDAERQRAERAQAAGTATGFRRGPGAATSGPFRRKAR